ncbi:MAG: hypothetical protein HRF49_11565 [bacterium]|jgi:hypothetical protein
MQDDAISETSETGGNGTRVTGFLGWLKSLRAKPEPHPDPTIRVAESQEELIKWLRRQVRLQTPFYSFIRGIATGLGIALGTGLVLSLILTLLGRLSLVPIIGKFAHEVLEYIRQTNGGG